MIFQGGKIDVEEDGCPAVGNDVGFEGVAGDERGIGLVGEPVSFLGGGRIDAGESLRRHVDEGSDEFFDELVRRRVVNVRQELFQVFFRFGENAAHRAQRPLFRGVVQVGKDDMGDHAGDELFRIGAEEVVRSGGYPRLLRHEPGRNRCHVLFHGGSKLSDPVEDIEADAWIFRIEANDLLAHRVAAACHHWCNFSRGIEDDH